MLAVNKGPEGLYSVCTPQGIICQAAERYAAAEAIAAAVTDISEAEIFDLLDSPCEPAEFRTAWASAVSNSILEIESDIDSLPNAETVRDLSDRQARLFTAVSGLQREIHRGMVREKIKELEAAVQALYEKCVKALADRGLSADTAAWNAAMQSDLGIRLVEMREELAAS